MNPLEIALIIIGVMTVIVSCIMVDRSGKTVSHPAGQPFSLENSLTQEEKNKLVEKMKEQLTDVSEETVVRTDDALSRLSNEKIIAVNEFSDQILEKIKRNHEEVVFLYNMLNDKEKELKAAVKEIDSSRKKVQDIMETRANAEKAQTVKAAKGQEAAKPAAPAARADKPVKSTDIRPEASPGIPVLNGLNPNSNSQILTLYSQGKTVIEISKLLGLGQGEVKLVIDLFKGKKGEERDSRARVK